MTALADPVQTDPVQTDPVQTDPVQTDPVQTDPVQLVSDGLRQLRESIPVSGDAEVRQRLRAVESLSRQAHAVMLELVGEIELRSLARQAGFGSTARRLEGMLLLSKAEARTRVTHAEQVGSRRALTGEQLPPRCPATAAGLAAGEIGPGQLRIIAEAVAAIPDSTGTADREWAESHLAGWAPRLDPAALGRLASRVLALLDPDGPEPATEPQRPRRRGRCGCGIAAAAGWGSRAGWMPSTALRCGS